jgi:hypothetical protein
MADKRQRNRKTIQNLALEIVLDLARRRREAKKDILSKIHRISINPLDWYCKAQVMGAQSLATVAWIDYWKDHKGWTQALKLLRELKELA